MKTHEFVLLALDAMGGEVKGKTLLQKRLYFIALLSGILPELNYVAHYYGPYSDALSDAASQMRSLGFIRENVQSYGIVSRSGFEVLRHDYSLTSDGSAVLDSIKERSGELVRSIRDAWQRIEKTGDLNYMQLSFAAKVYHILQMREEPWSKRDIAAVAKTLGWQLASDDISKAEDFLARVDLIEFIENSPH